MACFLLLVVFVRVAALRFPEGVAARLLDAKISLPEEDLVGWVVEAVGVYVDALNRDVYDGLYAYFSSESALLTEKRDRAAANFPNTLGGTEVIQVGRVGVSVLTVRHLEVTFRVEIWSPVVGGCESLLWRQAWVVVFPGVVVKEVCGVCGGVSRPTDVLCRYCGKYFGDVSGVRVVKIRTG